MKNLLTVLFLLGMINGTIAQLSINGTYSTISTSGWEDIFTGENVDAYENGYTIGLEYWFRLKDFRVEFLPELSYSRHDNIIKDAAVGSQELTSELDILTFAFNTQIYLFDMEGDCDCPTWGKEGGIFKKGFYLMAGPGVGLIRQTDLITIQDPKTDVNSQTTRFMLSAGLGLDIGLSKSLTLTPFGRFRWFISGPSTSLETLAIINQNEAQYTNFDSTISQLQAGLRISYRWGE